MQQTLRRLQRLQFLKKYPGSRSGVNEVNPLFVVGKGCMSRHYFGRSLTFRTGVCMAAVLLFTGFP
jgi:hypothetical protein